MAKKAKSVTAKKVKSSPKKIVKKVAAKKVKASAGKKVKAVAMKKVKSLPKKKVKIAVKKNLKSITKNKTKKFAVNTVKPIAKVKIARQTGGKVAKKALKLPVRTKVKSAAKPVSSAGGKQTKKANKKEIRVKSPALKVALPEIEMHGEDLHFIPEHKQKQPTTTLEVHSAENTFHHKEEVAFHQENKKVQQSIVSQKNLRRFGKRSGRR